MQKEADKIELFRPEWKRQQQAQKLDHHDWEADDVHQLLKIDEGIDCSSSSSRSRVEVRDH